MDRFFEKLTSHLAKNPRRLFLIDSAGALLTAVLLCGVLSNLSPYIGMPKTTLDLLFSIAACFWLYSSVCFLFLKTQWTLYIRLISFANLLYCALTIAFLFIHYNKLTILDFTYFLTETAIICLLVYTELSVSGKILNKR
ncbi:MULTISPECIES: hypothetical protein [unclassified Flavobacterium]|uniref:hypothetical protein n=1 Tax=unclassified Flavobacterium TaxID=196869 RepID=UPI00105C07D9|nr:MULTISPECIES: hypothetical protein [unclassified Flavobacterium]TDP00212.1 hypothetical protein EV145_10699 [Flavobacterium sp. 245]TDW52180.1 hypothetical protein EV144_101866 [Flavobacterium sp. 270]